jgi:hypothetical protein
MVAKRRSLTERFSYCLTQFTRDYNWICRCINKKSSENLNSFAATGHKVLQACRCGFRAGLRASRWFWVRALGCGVLSQSTSGPPRVTTWSNSGKPRQCGRVAKKFTKKFTYAGEVAVGLEQPATCSFFGLRSKLGAGVGGAGVGRAGAACGISLATGNGIA